MDRSRWASLVVVGLYMIALGVSLFSRDEARPLTGENILKGILGIGGWLAVSLGCIWWGDELGDGLVGARFGLISSTSPGWAVKLMGWVLLLLPGAIAVFAG